MFLLNYDFSQLFAEIMGLDNGTRLKTISGKKR